MIVTVAMMSIVQVVAFPRAMVVAVGMIVQPDPWRGWSSPCGGLSRRSLGQRGSAAWSTASHRDSRVTSPPCVLTCWWRQVVIRDLALLLGGDCCNNRTNFELLLLLLHHLLVAGAHVMGGFSPTVWTLLPQLDVRAVGEGDDDLRALAFLQFVRLTFHTSLNILISQYFVLGH